MLESFLDHLRLEKRFSNHTLLSYQTDLRQLIEYLECEFEGLKVEEVSHEVLRSWIVKMVEDGKSPRTINRKISALKSYFKWGIKFKGFKTDPTQKIVLPKISKRLPVYVEESHMESLLDYSVFPNSYEGRRDELIIDLFYQSGMRCAELINLKKNDISYGNHTIKVLGKRNKERLIPLSDELAKKISEFSLIKGEIDPVEDIDYLFLTSKGAKLYPKLVYRIVNNYLSKVSALRKKSPHVLRHSFATHMLNRGADLNAIKEILGHASLAATQVYTHNSIEKLKEIHRKSHPNG